jgi:hypothetical protein
MCPEEGWWKFWERLPKLSINFEVILSCAHGNFKERSKVFGFALIIINYCLIINAYYKVIIMHSRLHVLDS